MCTKNVDLGFNPRPLILELGSVCLPFCGKRPTTCSTDNDEPGTRLLMCQKVEEINEFTAGFITKRTADTSKDQRSMSGCTRMLKRGFTTSSEVSEKFSAERRKDQEVKLLFHEGENKGESLPAQKVGVRFSFPFFFSFGVQNTINPGGFEIRVDGQSGQQGPSGQLVLGTSHVTLLGDASVTELSGGVLQPQWQAARTRSLFVVRYPQSEHEQAGSCQLFFSSFTEYRGCRGLVAHWLLSPLPISSTRGATGLSGDVVFIHPLFSRPSQFANWSG